MKEREMVLEFYDRLLQNMKRGKGYLYPDLRKMSEKLVEAQLKPIYGEMINEYRIKEQVPFMLGWLMGTKLLSIMPNPKGPPHLYKRLVSKQELQEELKVFLEKFPRRERK